MSPADGEPWKVRVWGQGGSGCLSLRLGEALIVLDAGKALEALVGDRTYWGPARQVWLLLSHYHEDHVAGLSHAAEWLRSSLTLRVAGPRDSAFPLSGFVAEKLEGISEDLLRDSTRCFELGESARLPEAPLKVDTLAAMHPGICLAYRLSQGARSLVFCPDNELKMTDLEEGRGGAVGKLEQFAKGTSLLIHDSRYSNRDYPSFKGGGHSNPSTALTVALRAEAERLMLYHLDPKYDVEALTEIEAGTAAAAAKKVAGPRCVLARDGFEVSF